MEWLLAIVALCLVIVVHEAGHYVAAVATGMKVDRFSVFGIGPAVLRLGTWRGTEFVVSAIPFGAYVLIRGMEPEEEGDAAPTPDSSNFRDKPLWARFLALFGGPAANYLAAMAIFFGLFAAVGTETVAVGGFTEPSPARAAGLAEGDRLVEVAGVPIEPPQAAAKVVRATKAHLGETVEVVVERDGALQTFEVPLAPEPPALGVSLAVSPWGGPVPWTTAAAMAVMRPLEISAAQLVALSKLITGQIEGELSGPVAIVKHIKQSAEAGAVPFFFMTAFISTLLGLFNLLPLPALDGGRIVFLAYEAVTRRKPSPQVEGWVHGIGLVALLLLMVFVTIGDVRGG